MKSIEIESWAHRVLQRVENRFPVEDSRVELKAEWLPSDKAARRLAGHANAARGETILWLIGADEKKGVVSGANSQELANWFAKVRSQFESEFPSLQDLNIDYKGKTVAALCFDTSRFPYVVKNQGGGPAQFEVPWREGTAVRTATRSDLILMLSPLVRAPKLELLEGEVILEMAKGSDCLPSFRFSITAYITPLTTDTIVFPRHKCKAQIWSDITVLAEAFKINLDTPSAQQQRAIKNANLMASRARLDGHALSVMHVDKPTNAIERTEDELLVRGPGKVILAADDGATARYSGQDRLEVRAMLVEAISDLPVLVVGSFSKVKETSPNNQATRWILDS